MSDKTYTDPVLAGVIRDSDARLAEHVKTLVILREEQSKVLILSEEIQRQEAVIADLREQLETSAASTELEILSPPRQRNIIQ